MLVVKNIIEKKTLVFRFITFTFNVHNSGVI